MVKHIFVFKPVLMIDMLRVLFINELLLIFSFKKKIIISSLYYNLPEMHQYQT